MDKTEQRRLLSLARKVTENELLSAGHDLSVYQVEPFQKRNGVFVTLLKNGQLRGCIGRIETGETLYRNVIELARSAAFEDHRFDQLTDRELDMLQIEISILTEPREVAGASSVEKVMKVRPGKDGVVLSANGRRATFLPQVWDTLPIREDFISDLCRKAGLPRDYWKKNPITLSTYQVEHFKED